jgi:carbon monoxide dehydrogenase subunit G
MLKSVAVVAAILLVVGIAGVLVLAAAKPDTLRVQRSAAIKAPPQTIFALINDFHQWAVWSPYEHKDPAMQRSMSGAASGTGAVYEWNGNRNVGQGRMEIIESAVPSRIAIKLDFLRPIEGHNTATFTLEPKDGGTDVTWTMDGPNRFLAKVMGVFFDMDKLIGGDFAVGLANLKQVAEKQL